MVWSYELMHFHYISDYIMISWLNLYVSIYVCIPGAPDKQFFLNGCLAKQPFLSSKDLESFNRKKHSFWSGYIRFQVWYCKCSMHHMNDAFFGASSRRLKSFHHFKKPWNDQSSFRVPRVLRKEGWGAWAAATTQRWQQQPAKATSGCSKDGGCELQKMGRVS